MVMDDPRLVGSGWSPLNTPDERAVCGLGDDSAMPEDPTDAAYADTLVPSAELHEVGIVVPPGADTPRDATLAQAIRPHWRSISIAMSAALVVAVVLLIVLPSQRSAAVRVVDTAPAIAQARQIAPAIVRIPTPLPAGWHADSSDFESAGSGAHLHLGYVGPDHGYNGVEDSNYSSKHAGLKVFVAQMTADGAVINTVAIHGVLWVHLISNRKSSQQSLVEYTPTITTVVTGTSSLRNLENLAASLQIH